MLLSQAQIAKKIKTFSFGSASAKNFDVLILKKKCITTDVNNSVSQSEIETITCIIAKRLLIG